MPGAGFPHRWSCRLTVLLEMLVEGVSIVVTVGFEVFQHLKRMELQRISNSYAFGLEELDFWTLLGHAITLLGIFIAFLILITGIRVLVGPCQLTPHVTDIRTLKRAVNVCSLWCSLEFLRFILLLLGLSIRLMVFALLAFDELTNTEIIRQGAILIPIATSLLAMAATNRYNKELEYHLSTELSHAHPVTGGFDVPDAVALYSQYLH